MKINIISESKKKFELLSQELTYIGIHSDIFYNNTNDNFDFIIIDNDYTSNLTKFKKSKNRITISNNKDNFLAIKLFNLGSDCHFVWSQDSSASIAWAMYYLNRKALIQINKENLKKQSSSLFEMFKISEISETSLKIIGHSKNISPENHTFSKLLPEFNKLNLEQTDIIFDSSSKYPYIHNFRINDSLNSDVLFFQKNKNKSQSLPKIIEASKDILGNLKIAVCSSSKKWTTHNFDFFKNLDFLKYTHYDYVLFDCNGEEVPLSIKNRQDIIPFNDLSHSFDDALHNFQFNLIETDHSTLFVQNTISMEKYFSYGFGFTSNVDFNEKGKFYSDRYQSFVKIFKKIKLPLVNKFYYEGFLENAVYADRLSLLQDIHKAKLK